MLMDKSYLLMPFISVGVCLWNGCFIPGQSAHPDAQNTTEGATVGEVLDDASTAPWRNGWNGSG